VDVLDMVQRAARYHIAAVCSAGSLLAGEVVKQSLSVFGSRPWETVDSRKRLTHTRSKSLNCANVRCKLTDTEAARLTLQWLWTNSPRRLLYPGPTLLVAPGKGTISWRSLVFLLNRARDTRNSFG